MKPTPSMKELVEYKGPDRVVHFTEFLALKTGIDTNTRKFNSRFPWLDKSLEGLETGEIIVITGYTKNGKTLFAESWLRGMAEVEPSMNPVIFSFEVKPDRILQKYALERGRPFYLPVELKTMSFEWLRDRCLEAKLKYNAKAILIDHLHFLVDMSTKQNMSLNIGAFMRRLKHEIALGLNMAVLLIAHQGQPKEGQEASLGGMRDSSFIGQESDATIIVSRRRDFDEPDAKEYQAKRLLFDKSILLPKPNANGDKYSAGLATVRIAVARRSGAYDMAKLYRKNGEFLEEV